MPSAAGTIRRAWTYVGIPELREAYVPAFTETPKVAFPYLSVKLATPNGRETPLIDCRLAPGHPFCIFPREVFVQLGVGPAEGIRARDPLHGEVRLVLLGLTAFGDDGASVTTRSRIALPLDVDDDPPEPVLGSFGFFSAFDVLLSRRKGIFVRSQRSTAR
jgi:hypothetical protein